MKWFLIVLMPFAILGAYFFYTNNMFAGVTADTVVASATSTSIVAQTGSGVRGIVKTTCVTHATDTPCEEGVFTIKVLQDDSVLSTFVSDEVGNFLQQLAPGQYDLQVDAASSTQCATVSVSVSPESYQTIQLNCVVGELQIPSGGSAQADSVLDEAVQ